MRPLGSQTIPPRKLECRAHHEMLPDADVWQEDHSGNEAVNEVRARRCAPYPHPAGGGLTLWGLYHIREAGTTFIARADACEAQTESGFVHHKQPARASRAESSRSMSRSLCRPSSLQAQASPSLINVSSTLSPDSV